MKLEAAKAIMAAALEVKQVEKYLLNIRSHHTLTEAEKHQLVLAEETGEKLIDVAARFNASVTNQMLPNETQPTTRTKR